MNLRFSNIREVLDVETTVGGNDTLNDLVVSKVTADSREISENSIFVAIEGDAFDGHRFIEDALEVGARALILESASYAKFSTNRKEDLARLLEEKKTLLYIHQSSRLAYSKLVSAYYGNPSSKLPCAAVTGTNGKTSISWIIANASGSVASPSAYIGTLGLGFLGRGIEQRLETNINTTPDALLIQEVLHGAVDNHCSSAILEATSQGIAQERITGIDWDIAIFSNLTRDHLDLHHSMEAYAACKKRLFLEGLAESKKHHKSAIINVDDPFGLQLADETASACPGVDIVRVSTDLNSFDHRDVDVSVETVEPAMDYTGIVFSAFDQRIEMQSQLIGGYNVENLALAVAALLKLGISPAELPEIIGQVPPVPGRLERVPYDGLHIYVDYCHTPDAIVSAQQSLKALCPGRLITVFGCGGDRDRGKRPLMAQAVAELADVAIATSDNPRTEDPESILDDVVAGLDCDNKRNGFYWHRESDRRSAIAYALQMATSDDLVLIAGKGHEDYQEVNGVRHPFCDRRVCEELLAELF